MSGAETQGGRAGGGPPRAPKPRPGPLEYLRRWPLQAIVGATALFLYLPLITLMAFSFNDSKRNIVWEGFTLKYYAKAFSDGELITAFANSLTIALICTLVSVILGALAAVALWRFRFPGKAAFEGAMALPIVVPEICMGVAMLVFFARVLPWPSGLAWPFNLGAITIAHISFSFPFVTTVVRARLASFNRELEEAAKDLGASDWDAFRDVLIPHMQPGLVAGALLAFTLSLDDFVITFFTAGPDTITFPVKVYSMLRFSVTPEVNAASTILIIVTIFFTFIGLQMQNRAEEQAKAAP
jgi:spermidine/putrescine transport system permease protein